MNRSNLVIALYLLLVFGSGIAVGGFGYHLYSATPAVKAAPKVSPEEWRRQHLNEMQTRLNLQPEQVHQVNTIMDETRSLFQEARKKHNAELSTLRVRQANKVRAILTDEQRPAYEKLRLEWEARSKAAKK